jgi:hypothetical protein
MMIIVGKVALIVSSVFFAGSAGNAQAKGEFDVTVVLLAIALATGLIGAFI